MTKGAILPVNAGRAGGRGRGRSEKRIGEGRRDPMTQAVQKVARQQETAGSVCTIPLLAQLSCTALLPVASKNGSLRAKSTTPGSSSALLLCLHDAGGGRCCQPAAGVGWGPDVTMETTAAAAAAAAATTTPTPPTPSAATTTTTTQ